MFTGIIQAVGTVAAHGAQRRRPAPAHPYGQADLDDVAIGDSIATSGVCLTVTALPGDGFWADVSNETLSLTTLGDLARGRASTSKNPSPESRLGGHIVSGHVDGLGEVVSLARGRALLALRRARAGCAGALHRPQGQHLCRRHEPHGERRRRRLLRPQHHSADHGRNRIRRLPPGHRVNLEVDVIARYLERLLQGDAAALPGGGVWRHGGDGSPTTATCGPRS
jgi:riboflavin synthase